jgi:hypothetical protein
LIPNIDKTVVLVGGEASIVVIRDTLGMLILLMIDILFSLSTLVTIQDVVTEINKINRMFNRLRMNPKDELAVQVTVCMTNLEVGFPHQTRWKIK